MTRKALLTLCIAVLLSGLLTLSAFSATNTRADIADAKQIDNISSFNIGPYQTEVRNAVSPTDQPLERSDMGGSQRRPLGSAQSTNVGIGPGVSIDLTWADEQYGWGLGRQVAHWWNGQTDETMEASVHFAYIDRPDTLAGYPFGVTGYNVYDAAVTSTNWPRGQDIGCDLQNADTLGQIGRAGPSLAMTFNGRAVIASRAQHFIPFPRARGFCRTSCTIRVQSSIVRTTRVRL